MRALCLSWFPGLPALPDARAAGCLAAADMRRPPGADRTTPESGDTPPWRDDPLQDVWSGWTDETIPTLFAHLYLFRLAAHMVLSPAQLRAIADRMGQLTCDLRAMNDQDDEEPSP